MICSREKEKWIMYTLAILLCLVLTTFWLMCNMYAKYSAKASGSDSARVAKFNVTEEGTATQQIKADVYPGFSQTYNVSVTNASEVAISYSMDIQNKYANLPLEFKMLDSNDNEITSKSIDISATDHGEHIYKLEISWPTDSDDNKSAEYAGKTDLLEITLSATQKD